GAVPPAHDTPCGARSPHWPWGRPGRYYGRAGDRRSAEAAPTDVAVRDRSALPPAPVSCRFLSADTRGKSARVPAGACLHPPPAPATPALPPPPRPSPAAPSAHLTAGLPSREGDGLTTLQRRNPRGLGPALTPVAHHLRRVSLQHPDLATYRFGPSLSAPLA